MQMFTKSPQPRTSEIHKKKKIYMRYLFDVDFVLL